jgi:uncharacterized repeat protein (TIGR03803 family)
MITRVLNRYALWSCVAAATLAGCGGSQAPIGAPGAMPQAMRIAPTHGVVEGAAPLFYHVLHSFGSGSDGQGPHANLIDVNGTLYGTTAMGGRYCHSSDTGGCGTVFSISKSGTEHVLYSFRGGSDGEYPAAGLIDVNGVLYGTTVKGGANCGTCGTVYSISTAGKEKVLHRFTGQPDGGYPWAGLIDVNGTLYGTTTRGGTYNLGTAFSISTSGKETVLHSFAGYQHRDGSLPFAGLINVNGTLYGTTNGGGKFKFASESDGTVFSMSTTGEEHLLHSFQIGSRGDGANPYASLIDVNGVLYGTTFSGGTTYCCGTVFRIDTHGKERVLYSFHTADGLNPYASLIDVKGRLYGTTESGGENKYGTVFSISTTGNVRVLHSFGGSDGADPNASLLNVNGTLYGTTSSCNSSCGGTVFALTP